MRHVYDSILTWELAFCPDIMMDDGKSPSYSPTAPKALIENTRRWFQLYGQLIERTK